MNWGHGIFVALAAFMLMILGFVWRASHQQTDLVSEDYYEQELAFQEKIIAQRNANELSAPVVAECSGGQLHIRFPDEVHGGVQGTITLFRPSDKALDRSFQIRDELLPSFTIPTADLLPGAYRLQAAWTDPQGTPFHAEQDLIIP